MNLNRISAVATAFMLSIFGGIGQALAQDGAPDPLGAPTPWQVGLQGAASPVKEALVDFHNLLFYIITAICVLVLALLVYVVLRFNDKKNPTPSSTSHNTLIEIAWTALPVLILLVIAIPSFRVLYFMDRTEEAEMTLKVTGRQWYWDYEYTDQEGVAFSSYMIPEEDLGPGQRRLLEVDERVVLPVGTNIRVLVTAGDVIHSWAVPAFGIKTDAVPGRVNETWVRIEQEGVYYGQCSEICGTGHAFMPIAVEAVSKERFAQWVAEKQTAMKTDGAAPAVQVAQQAR
ncbi:cytochrome c oxidase subunit II [Arenibaculum sp.]|jgi:cytochrome c oxidase subunit 2|uniref:cytochrome c oxidase subunit II n=1 Tax=Arenibaculum sp. TaxID=2865862 RepID=UPI002E0EBFD9|nr:cytochrome c oxidase subunit II [Arenibaculum sp.]